MFEKPDSDKFLDWPSSTGSELSSVAVFFVKRLKSLLVMNPRPFESNAWKALSTRAVFLEISV